MTLYMLCWHLLAHGRLSYFQKESERYHDDTAALFEKKCNYRSISAAPSSPISLRLTERDFSHSSFGFAFRDTQETMNRVNQGSFEVVRELASQDDFAATIKTFLTTAKTYIKSATRKQRSGPCPSSQLRCKNKAKQTGCGECYCLLQRIDRCILRFRT